MPRRSKADIRAVSRLLNIDHTLDSLLAMGVNPVRKARERGDEELALRMEALIRSRNDPNRPTRIRPPKKPPKRGAAPTPGEQALWVYLHRRCGTADQLADPKVLDTSAVTIRMRVVHIRKKKGRDSIQTMPGFGYYRPDAPPDWDSLKATRKRRVSPK